MHEEVVPAPSMLQARTMHASVAAGRELFVIGGKTCGPRECGSLLAVEALDPVKGVWTTKSQLPRGIYYPEVAACRDVIYVLGSRVETSDLFNPSLDCFLSYSVFADQWTELVAEFGHFFHATLVKAVAVHSTLYICDLSTYKVYSFWPEKGSGLWKGEGSFECVGFNAGAVSVGESIFMLGGDYSPEEVTDEVQVYHRSSSKWEEVSPMPHPLTEFHCGLVQFPRHRDPWKSL
uniref:Uncharacterized protein n=1 Tax=Eptatretus burgeri TaxID=7764 RepID=A0A8C4Q339_EPTBU